MTIEELKHHDCRAASEYSWWEYDAQNIPLDRVCNICREAKLSKYRPCILTGYTQADVGTNRKSCLLRSRWQPTHYSC